MNKGRRERLKKQLRLLEEMREEIEAIRDGEQEAYDNLPEPLQDSERGERLEENIETLDNILENLEPIAEELDELAEA